MAHKHEPKPEIMRIEEIVSNIIDGDIKLPRFQRPFVWNKRHILELWDSIYHGYPVGSLLLWLTNNRLSSERTLGDLTVNERPTEYPTNYVLDGQQRLSSLCGVLYWPEEDPNSQWNVAFDLRSEEFFNPTDRCEPHQFPMNKLLSTFDFNETCNLFADYPDSEQLVERAHNLLSAVKDYKIAVVVLGDMEIDEVAPVFERINSKGRRLTMVDLMVAATWSDSFDLSIEIDSIKDSLENKNFDSLEEKPILRNISAATEHGITSGDMDSLRKLDEQTLTTAVTQCREAYQLAVDFLFDEIGVPSKGFLPYTLQLVLLVEFFRNEPQPTITQRKELRRWFWEGAISEHFSGANTAFMTQSVRLIREFANQERDYMRIDSEFDLEQFLYSDFNLNKAISKTFALILASARPRSLNDGSPINIQRSLATTNREEFHHIFPRQYLKDRGVDDNKLINRHVNLCLLNLGGNRKYSNRPPSEYFIDIINDLGNDMDEILESNLIPESALDAIMEDDYEAFSEKRFGYICSYIKNELIS